MRHLVSILLSTLAVVACGGEQAAKAPATGAEEASASSQASGGEATAPSGSAASAPVPQAAEQAQSSDFVLNTAPTPKDAPRPASKIKPTRTEAALKLTVVDKETGPLFGIVISLTGADGKKYYTEQTNTEGYTELLVPVGQKYEIVYLSLGRREIGAGVTVTDEPNQSLRLTLRYKGYKAPANQAPEPRFVLDGVVFDSGKATIKPESFPRLDAVVEYMTYKKDSRIEIAGHTDNQGNPKVNKTLSLKRAQACRDYLVSKGIDGGRVNALGYGDERPIAPNDNEEGRQLNRRIEATEL